MNALLLGEGETDRALFPIIVWLLRQHSKETWDVSFLKRSALGTQRGATLAQKVVAALSLQRCDLLFLHQDADNNDPELVRGSLVAASAQRTAPVVPVRAQEAWFLLLETELRDAAGKPNGRANLGLPKPAQVEGLANPKADLHAALRAASELTGRRAESFRPADAVQRIAESTRGWAHLRGLPSFNHLEQDTRAALAAVAG